MGNPEKILAIDVDEVKFPFITEFARWHNITHGTSLYPADFRTYRFEDPLGVDKQTVIERVYQFHEVDDSHVSPITGAREGLRVLSGAFCLSSVTARHPKFKQHTRRWIDTHGLPIDEVHTVGHPDTMKEHYTNKAQTCLAIGATALIDDSPDHVADCLDSGIDAVLFGDYPWNQAVPKGMTRCEDWSAVLRYFDVE